MNKEDSSASSTALLAERYADSPDKWEGKKDTYLWAQTAAIIKGNDQIPK